MYTYSVSGYDVNNKVCVHFVIFIFLVIFVSRRITTIFRYFPEACRNYSAFIIDLCVVRKSICQFVLTCLFFFSTEIFTVQLTIHQEGPASQIRALFFRAGRIVLRQFTSRGRRGMRRGSIGDGRQRSLLRQKLQTPTFSGSELQV